MLFSPDDTPYQSTTVTNDTITIFLAANNCTFTPPNNKWINYIGVIGTHDKAGLVYSEQKCQVITLAIHMNTLPDGSELPYAPTSNASILMDLRAILAQTPIEFYYVPAYEYNEQLNTKVTYYPITVKTANTNVVTTKKDYLVIDEPLSDELQAKLNALRITNYGSFILSHKTEECSKVNLTYILDRTKYMDSIVDRIEKLEKK